MTAAAVHDLTAAAASALAPRVGLAVDELLHRLDAAESAERTLLLDRATDGLPPPTSRACRILLDRAPASAHGGSSAFADLLLDGGSDLRSVWALVAVVSRLLPAGREPAILFTPTQARAPSDWLQRVALTAAQALEEHPSLSIAVTAAAFDDLPESRAAALLREGAIPLPSLAAEDIAATLVEQGIPPARAPASCVARLAADGADDDLVALYARAARAEGDGARSEAERFLFARLASLPWAAGRFTLNGRPGFRFGGREAEVDLLAADLRVAIEIDGYYHFQDREAYRRDRRKDRALQEHGYLVLRFLAEDVVARLEEILDIVAQAVDHRTALLGGRP